MNYETINQAIAAVMNGETTAVQVAADVYPGMSYAIEYYSPARGEWDTYQAIRTEWKKLESAAVVPAPTTASTPVEMKKCSCGHTIPKTLVMSASMGSSCPDCYDKMSN